MKLFAKIRLKIQLYSNGLKFQLGLFVSIFNLNPIIKLNTHLDFLLLRNAAMQCKKLFGFYKNIYF